jgi:hypothetical protein
MFHGHRAISLQTKISRLSIAREEDCVSNFLFVYHLQLWPNVVRTKTNFVKSNSFVYIHADLLFGGRFAITRGKATMFQT